MNKTVQELAVLLGGTVIGNGDALIGDVKSLEEAGQNDITFAVDPYTEYLPQVHAGAVIVDKEVPAGDNTLVIVENPRLAFSQLLVLFHPVSRLRPVFIRRPSLMSLPSSGKMSQSCLMPSSVKMLKSVTAL